MSPNPRSLLAQHAKTTQLLGVDFLPLGNPPPSHFQSQFENHPTSKPIPEPPAHPQPDSTIEPKPIHDFAPTPQTPPTPKISITTDTTSIRAAHESLTDPQQKLDALQEKYTQDAPHANFTTSFTNTVFGQGNPAADLMFIGEAPGQQEDQSGLPFVGPAGQLLDKMILAMGLSRESVYITNVLKTRPPNNATPTRDEALACAPYLYEQIRIINPKVIVTLGLPATHLLLDTTQPMRAMRGHFHSFPPASLSQTNLPTIDLMPTYHPAFLLRAYTQDNRAKVWSDLTQVIEKLGLSKP